MPYLFWCTFSCLFSISQLKLAWLSPTHSMPPTYKCSNGQLLIKSDAPLELIEAKSNTLRGIIDPENQSFAWVVDVKTLKGFNSPLQQEHFNENYLESNRFPNASFSGKIIEKVNFETSGTLLVRAKGILNIHGVEQERIIKAKLEISAGQLRISSNFTVLLADHGIAIPRIVHQKIAEEVSVQVNANLKKSQ
jgi:hypothetical protein